VGLKEEDLAAVKQFKLKALALQFVYIVKASNSSALALCEHFLEQVEDTQRFVYKQVWNDNSRLLFIVVI
jgi:integrator complex subunit 4